MAEVPKETPKDKLPAKSHAGRPPLALTPKFLAKLEKIGASGVNQKWAAQALCINVETFIIKRREYPEFSEAWERGKAKFAAMILEAAPKIMSGLIKNGITKTDSAPGGNVSAQLGFIEKVLRRTDAEEIPGHVNFEELGNAPDAGPIEIQEVRIRRITRNKGRIEDDILTRDDS